MRRDIVKDAVVHVSLELTCPICGGFGFHDHGAGVYPVCEECDGAGVHVDEAAEVRFDYLPAIPDSGWSPESYDPGCEAEVSSLRVIAHRGMLGEDVTSELTEGQSNMVWEAAQDHADSAEPAEQDQWCSSDE